MQDISSNTSREIVRLLWTGGWDSTFRLVELSRQDVTVQPIYMYGDGRQSMEIEVRVQDEILELLRNHEGTKAKLLPVERVDINKIPKNKNISDAYHRIIEKHKLGSQYEWIGWYATVNPGCELCVEKQYTGGNSYMARLIDATGKVAPTNDVHKYRVESSNSDVMLLLGNVYLPTIGTTEVEMVSLVKSWGGVEDIMKHIWFCHTPIKGKPCGMCRPCCEKMESGMEFLLDERARKRYRLFQKYGETKLFKLYKRIRCLR